jgi:tetratricopeptide (TPR) repeat protein
LTPPGKRVSLAAVRAPPILLLALVCAALPASAAPETASPGAFPDRGVELFVQRRLVDARTFREQGRLEAAERALERALAVAPDAVEAHRLMARVLEEQGRRGDAARHWTRADELDPPPPPPPDAALPVPSEGLAVVLVEPGARADAPDARARRPAPDTELDILRKRLATRLPWAVVVRADPGSVAAARETLRGHKARAAISLRTDRGFCGYSRKDGEFAVAWLRVASATPTGLVAAPSTVHEVRTNPPGGDACVPWVMARALEKVLLETDVLDAARAHHEPDSGEWPSPALRALFPGIGRRVTLHLERGRAQLATGRIAHAAESFRSALALDPEDGDARAYLKEAEDTIEIARALTPDGVPGSSLQEHGVLEFTLTPAERAIAEALLEQERRRRDELLAALVIAEVEERPPPAEAVATLRPTRLKPHPAPGPRLARERTEDEIEARSLISEDGAILTVYYFPAGRDEPTLREEDTTGDGKADRWIGYEGGVRRDLWEDRIGRQYPDIHVRFAPDGTSVESISVDDDDDTRPERVFRYADGMLASESRDTDGDDVLDRFESFDEEGRVVTREDDLNADGHPDVRTRYRDGRIVTREIEDPAVVESLLKGGD